MDLLKLVCVMCSMYCVCVCTVHTRVGAHVLVTVHERERGMEGVRVRGGGERKFSSPALWLCSVLRGGPAQPCGSTHSVQATRGRKSPSFSHHSTPHHPPHLYHFFPSDFVAYHRPRVRQQIVFHIHHHLLIQINSHPYCPCISLMIDVSSCCTLTLLFIQYLLFRHLLSPYPQTLAHPATRLHPTPFPLPSLHQEHFCLFSKAPTS